jgi:YidC/Oxa1 family membrane protein insertase
MPRFQLRAAAPLSLEPGQSKEYHTELYVGPKGYVHLKALGCHLEESVNFGIFGFLGKAVLRALFYFQHITGNYGWSIIIITTCLQIILFPLTIKSYRASAAMKQLQPQIKALQAKYKADPKRLNVEMMNLYKTSGTNPFGGCLPMVLQIPIFWALFTTLRNAFELRGAPFMFWIKDLSMHDPYYVLPILMGIGMLVQQKMTAAPADPAQAKMMMLMPIVFTVLFLHFPSGLVLYWFTNSLLTMAGQGMIMMQDKKRAR